MTGPILVLIGLAVSFCLVVVVSILIKDWKRSKLQRQINPEYRWHFYQQGLDVMRRRAIDGSWQYRPMSDGEHFQHVSDRW